MFYLQRDKNSAYRGGGARKWEESGGEEQRGPAPLLSKYHPIDW